jgi:hypothetical protein
MTTIIFRKLKPSNQIIALFPLEPATMDPQYCVYYTTREQHGTTVYKNIIKVSKPCSPAEYNDLLRRLIFIGYDDLNIMQKRPANDYDIRREKINPQQIKN